MGRRATNSGIPPKLYSKKIQIDYIQYKNEINGNVGNRIQRVKIVINNNIIEQVTDFKYLGYRISECGSDLEDKLLTYNKINGGIRRHFENK